MIVYYLWKSPNGLTFRNFFTLFSQTSENHNKNKNTLSKLYIVCIPAEFCEIREIASIAWGAREQEKFSTAIRKTIAKYLQSRRSHTIQ